MFSLRSLALTLAVLVSPGVAAPLQPLKDLSRVAVRSGVEDVQLRAISRSSAKRDQVNNLIPRSSPLNLDYVDGQLNFFPKNCLDFVSNLTNALQQKLPLRTDSLLLPPYSFGLFGLLYCSNTLMTFSMMFIAQAWVYL